MRGWTGAAVLGLLAVAAMGHGLAQKGRAAKVVVDPAARVGVVTREFTPKAVRNWRGDPAQTLRCVIWYPAVDTAVETRQTVGDPAAAGGPAAALFEAGMAMPHAQFQPALEKWPVVLLSHGTGGSAMQMAWLGTALARAGFIAVAVDHPGNNANGKITAEGFALWWERATDLSNVLDGMLADQTFGPKIDARLVVAAGYSLGGYTVLELAGARTDISAFFDLCSAKPNAGPNGAGAGATGADKRGDDAVCHVPEMRGMGSVEQILAAARKTSGESLARSGESYRDPRIKAVFAIAPALGFTQTQESLRQIRVPVEIVAGDADRIAPPRENADYLRANIRGARETVLPRVEHDTFLDTCTAAGKRALPQFCDDEADRDAVHAQVAGMAVRFFYGALKLK